MTAVAKKIKIVFALNDFLIGGVQRQLIRQLKFYDRQKFEITILTFFQFNEEDEMYRMLPDHVRVYKFNFTGYRDIKNWISVYKTLKAIRPDIVISSLFFSNTVIRVLKIFLGYPVIAREHNTYFSKSFIEKSIDRILSHVTAKIVCVSKTVAVFTARQEKIATEKFVTIHNGIDLEEIGLLKKKYLKNKDRFSLPRSGKLVLNVARLTTQKNHENLIKAFHEFTKKKSEYYLVILGDGSLRDRLKNLIRELNCENSVFLLGNRSDIENFYCSAEFFISASKMEGLSNAYLEALAFGLPVVSTKTAGTDEIIQDGANGYFIRSGNIDDIITSLNIMTNTITMNNMKKAALATANQFDIRKTVQKYETLFREIHSIKL